MSWNESTTGGPDDLSRSGRATQLIDDASVDSASRATHAGSATSDAAIALRRATDHDVSTGLFNASGLTARLAARLAVADVHQTVAVLEIDNFDALTRNESSPFINAILEVSRARLLRTSPSALVGHLGRARFVVVEQTRDNSEPRKFGERLAKAMTEPVVVDGQRVRLSWNVGVAASAGRTSSAATLLSDAAIAAQGARQVAGTSVRVFDPALAAAATARLELERELRKSVVAADFRLHFQPIVRTADTQVRAVEALLRWGRRGPAKYEPDDFIPLAEQNGLIVPLGAWTIRAAAQAQHAVAPDVRVAMNVNLSARQLAEPGLTETIRRELADHDIPPRLTAFEITETRARCDMDVAARVIGDIRSLGCSVGVDDFGTGFATLEYLHRLPVNFMKIDRSFIADVGGDPRADALVRAMLGMAHGLKLAVVAEGVETHLQHATLVEMGCTYAQGYFYGRPQPSLPQAFATTNVTRSS